MRWSAHRLWNSTNFASVMFQPKGAPDQSIRFFYNTCQDTNRKTVGGIEVQCISSGQTDHQWFDATLKCNIPVNRVTDGAGIIITPAGATPHVNISLDSKLEHRDIHQYTALCMVSIIDFPWNSVWTKFTELVLFCRWPVPFSFQCICSAVWTQLQCDCAGWETTLSWLGGHCLVQFQHCVCY